MITYTDYLNADHHIFPLQRMVDGRCECGNPECKAIGKHPMMSNWQYITTWDEEQLANLEDDFGITGVNRFADGFGVNLAGRHLLVVDIDARNGGVESASQITQIIMASGFVVNTGSGNGSKHVYFSLPEEWRGKALRAHVDTLNGIDFKSTGFVVGCGSLHKSGNRYTAQIGSPSDIGDAPQALLEMLHRPERSRTMFEGKAIEYTDQELHDVVMAIKNDGADYERWIRVGMGVHDATGGSGYDLWVKWSSLCKTAHDETDMPLKWGSFGRSSSSVTVGTLMAWAKADGYETPVSFVDNTEWEPVETKLETPESTAGIDLMRPPGLVGKIVDWINSRSIYPRKQLAVAAALQLVSNAAGLRYRIAPLDTSLNLITFGVAGSGSGKGSILSCLSAGMQAAGLQDAVYGGIKSEQEIMRNAMRHQASFFTIDEVGAFLSKIGGAKKSGGKTPYLENVSTKIMELYSAANDVYAISGDMKSDLREAIDKDIFRVQKRLESGNYSEGEEELKGLIKQRDASKAGIPNPFVSFFGVSEPHSFTEATNDWNLLVGGFLGRALVFEEMDSVPMRRPLHEISRDPIPSHIASQLATLYANGYASTNADARVELRGSHSAITMTQEAEAEQDRIYMYWHNRGRKEQDDGSGLSPLTNRALELTLKVAGTLAVSTTLITIEHMRWAHALVKKVTDLKISKAKALTASDSKDMVEKGDGLLQAIYSVLAHGDYHTIGVITNRFRSKYTKAQLQEGIDHLVASGKVTKEEVRDGGNRLRTRYSLNKK